MKNDSPPSNPPPLPPPLPPSLSNSRSSIPHRIIVDDLHQSPLLNSLSSINGESRSSISSTDRSLNSPLSKYVSNRRESDLISPPITSKGETAPRIREISSNVGFVSLPDQVRRRAIKKGFEFNLMVVGKDLHIENENKFVNKFV